MFLLGGLEGLCPEVSVQGREGLCSRGLYLLTSLSAVFVMEAPRQRPLLTVNRGRYASYWNALLLKIYVSIVTIVITGCNEVVAKVIFLHLFVILFTGGDVCLSACWDTTPLDQTPPGADTPQSRHPPDQTPQTRHPLGADTPRSRPPGADTPQTRHPPNQTPPGADTCPGADTPQPDPPGSRHPLTRPPPREADSSIRSTSGRYDSYWNAFLLPILFTIPCS